MSETAPQSKGNSIAEDQIRYVARLARLDLSPEEVTRFSHQLSAVLEHVETISRMPTDGVAPSSHALSLENVLREDIVIDAGIRDEVLAAAPAVEDDRFLVPRILGEAP